MTYTITSQFFIPVKADWVKIYNIIKSGEFLYVTQIVLKDEILDLISDLNPKKFFYETYELVTEESLEKIIRSPLAKIEFETNEEMVEARLRLP